MKRIQRQFAAVLSLAIVAIPLVAFMPWSGTGEQEGIPPSAAEETPPLFPSPILTLAPETPEPEYIPDAAEVEALAEQVVEYINEENFDGLKEMSVDEMSSIMNKERMDEAKARVSEDWG